MSLTEHALEYLEQAAQHPSNGMCTSIPLVSAFLQVTGQVYDLEPDCTMSPGKNTTALTSDIDCTSQCAGPGTPGFANSFVRPILAYLPQDYYCQVARMHAYVDIVHALAGQLGTSTACVYTPANATSGAVQCSGEGGAALTSILSTVASAANATCSCPTIGGRSTRTNACSGFGTCSADIPIVQTPPLGAAPHSYVLAATLNDTTPVEGAQCMCAEGFSGASCSPTTASHCPTCYHGTCGPETGYRCLCAPGYKGIQCDTSACPSAQHEVCSGNGVCRLSVCECNAGFTGAACHVPDPATQPPHTALPAVPASTTHVAHTAPTHTVPHLVLMGIALLVLVGIVYTARTFFGGKTRPAYLAPLPYAEVRRMPPPAPFAP